MVTHLGEWNISAALSSLFGMMTKMKWLSSAGCRKALHWASTVHFNLSFLGNGFSRVPRVPTRLRWSSMVTASLESLTATKEE